MFRQQQKEPFTKEDTVVGRIQRWPAPLYTPSGVGRSCNLLLVSRT